MKVKISHSFDAETLKALRKAAKLEHRSVSNLIQKLMHDYVSANHPELLEKLNAE